MITGVNNEDNILCMEKTFIGIDPGEVGFITAIFPNGEKKFYSIDEHDDLDIGRIIKDIKERSWEVVACMEDVHAIFGASAGSTFNFGFIKGVLKGILIAHEIPYHLVAPKDWQKEIWIHQDEIYITKQRTFTDKVSGEKSVKSYKAVDPKPTSINAARRIFPNVDLRKNDRCRKIDDNKVDSLLIAEYARRKNL